MATKKDLVEAHSFSRRRLVTAFVSGAPGGREVEPVKPGRVIIGGIAMSVLLLAGAAISGILLGRPPAGWLDKGSFVISKDTGEQYVVLQEGDDAKLQRVPNYISAQLLIGEAELTPFTVRDKYIRDVPLGSDLGIEGAPASLPDPDLLLDDGWTACTAEGAGVKVALSDDDLVEDLDGSAFLVRSSGKRGQLWLIASEPDRGTTPGRSFRYAMPEDEDAADVLADAMGFAAVSDIGVVPTDWVNLFPLGPELSEDQFGVSRGGVVDYIDGGGETLRVGDLVTMDDRGAPAFYLLGETGPVKLTEFSATLYAALGHGAVSLDAKPGIERQSDAIPSEWPRELPEAAPDGPSCAVLHPDTDDRTRVSLAHRPTGQASPEDVSRGKHSVFVEPSRGAYVLSGGDETADGGTAYVIDSKAQRYALIGPLVPEYLGYGTSAAPAVPASWMDFFEAGVSLSLNAARRVPEDAPSAGGGDDQ